MFLLALLAIVIPIATIAWPIIGLYKKVRNVVLLGWITIWFVLIAGWIEVHYHIGNHYNWFNQDNPNGLIVFVELIAVIFALVTAREAFLLHDPY